jgi:hypothetical protein
MQCTYINQNGTNKVKRTAEFVLGLIGGLLGLSASLSVIFFNEILDILSALSPIDSHFGKLGIAAFVFSLLGIAGAAMVYKNGKLGGLIMVISAVGGLVSIFAGYLVPAVLLIIGGIISIRKSI